jgi:hypothetical protein
VKWSADAHRDAMQGSLDAAPTLLENRLWGWLLGYSSFDDYIDELLITPLPGPGYVTDDFAGEL